MTSRDLEGQRHDPISLEPIISKIPGDTHSVTMEHLQETVITPVVRKIRVVIWFYGIVFWIGQFNGVI